MDYNWQYDTSVSLKYLAGATPDAILLATGHHLPLAGSILYCLVTEPLGRYMNVVACSTSWPLCHYDTVHYLFIIRFELAQMSRTWRTTSCVFWTPVKSVCSRCRHFDDRSSPTSSVATTSC